VAGGDMAKLVQSAENNARINAVLIGAGVTVLDEEGENDPATTIYDLKTAISGEYNDIRRRTIAGKARLASDGAWSKGGPRPPYGYKQQFKNGRDRKQGFVLVPHEEEARNLRQIYRWYVETGLTRDGREKGGLTYAARKADEAAFPSPSSASGAAATAGQVAGRRP
jgi:hypothetical protein